MWGGFMFNDFNKYKSYIYDEMCSFFENLNNFYYIYNDNICDTKRTIENLCDFGILYVSINSDSLYEELIDENEYFEIDIFEELKLNLNSLIDCIDDMLFDFENNDLSDIQLLRDDLEDLFNNNFYSKVNSFETLDNNLLDNFNNIKISLKNALDNIYVNADAIIAKKEIMLQKSLAIDLFKSGNSIDFISKEIERSKETVRRYLIEENLIKKNLSKDKRQAYIRDNFIDNSNYQNISNLIDTLVEIFGVSRKTIKRDLKDLKISN